MKFVRIISSAADYLVPLLVMLTFVCAAVLSRPQPSNTAALPPNPPHPSVTIALSATPTFTATSLFSPTPSATPSLAPTATETPTPTATPTPGLWLRIGEVSEVACRENGVMILVPVDGSHVGVACFKRLLETPTPTPPVPTGRTLFLDSWQFYSK